MRRTNVPNLWIAEGSGPDMLLFDIPSDWMCVSSGILESLSCSPVIFVVGPRKVGKSTLSRYLANCIWSKMGRVAVLDLDPGQTEFTPPGTLALKTIQSTPLLGPPFTHQSMVDGLEYLGFLTPTEDPKLYLSSCKRLFAKFLASGHSAGIPLIVNTMGWTTGLGLSLLQSLLHMAPVSHLVAFSAGGAEPFAYVQEALFQETKFTPAFTPAEAPQVAYIEPAEAAGSATTRLKRVNPVDLRNLVFSSYLLGRFEPSIDRMLYPIKPITFRTAVPIAVSFDQIQIRTSSHQLPRSKLENLAVNLAIVGLASRTPSGVETVGIGLVRSVDLTNRRYLILTPVPVDILQEARVNCFILGSQYLSSNFVCTEENASGPYISYEGFNSTVNTGSSARKVRSNIGRRNQT